MYLTGISVLRVEDITEAPSGALGWSPSTLPFPRIADVTTPPSKMPAFSHFWKLHAPK